MTSIGIPPLLTSPQIQQVMDTKEMDEYTIISNIENFKMDSKLAVIVFEIGGENGLDFLSFNNLYETFLGCVANGVMTMGRLQHSMTVGYGSAGPSVVFKHSAKPVWQQEVHSARNITIMNKKVRCWYLSNTSSCKNVPTDPPSRVSLQRHWRFVYKDVFTYVLIQSHNGRTKNDALKSFPRYWFRIEISKKKPFQCISMAKSILAKLHDIVLSGDNNNIKIETDETDRLPKKARTQK